MAKKSDSITHYVEFLGAPGSGRTTLAALMIQELSPAALLYIDASPDRHLTKLLAPNPPVQTLADVAGHIPDPHLPNRDVIDWQFHDLTVSIGEEGDLLCVGPLAETMSVTDTEALAYGLRRLGKNYDYVVLDGWHPVIHAVCPAETLRSLLVLTPAETEASLQALLAQSAGTPAAILNRTVDGEFPAALEAAITDASVSFIGKVPLGDDPGDANVTDAFHNCLLKLDIPLGQHGQV